jgi:hypothetical protein
LQALAEQHGSLSLFSFWMDELDTDTNEEDAIPSPMRVEGKSKSPEYQTIQPWLRLIHFPKTSGSLKDAREYRIFILSA